MPGLVPERPLSTPHDLIPRNDDAFDALQKQLVDAVAADPTAFGVVAEDVAALQAAQATWNVAYPAHVNAQQEAHAATQRKAAARAKLEAVLRGAAKKINGTPGVDNARRRAAGLPEHDEARSPVGAPTTKPLGRVVQRGHATLDLHVADELTPKRTAKPKGARGYQLWVHVGDPAPADPSGYTFVRCVTSTPYTDVHPAADAGKPVQYLLRWENEKGDPGPWSDVVIARIPL